MIIGYLDPWGTLELSDPESASKVPQARLSCCTREE